MESVNPDKVDPLLERFFIMNLLHRSFALCCSMHNLDSPNIILVGVLLRYPKAILSNFNIFSFSSVNKETVIDMRTNETFV